MRPRFCAAGRPVCPPCLHSDVFLLAGRKPSSSGSIDVKLARGPAAGWWLQSGTEWDPVVACKVGRQTVRNSSLTGNNRAR